MKTTAGFDASGQAYFADMYVGAEEFHSIDCSTYLTNENDTLTGVVWTVPTGLTSMDEQINGNIASIKLKGDIAGTYYVGFSLDSQESTNTQDTREKVKIEVLDFV